MHGLVHAFDHTTACYLGQPHPVVNSWAVNAVVLCGTRLNTFKAAHPAWIKDVWTFCSVLRRHGPCQPECGMRMLDKLYTWPFEGTNDSC